MQILTTRGVPGLSNESWLNTGRVKESTFATLRSAEPSLRTVFVRPAK